MRRLIESALLILAAGALWLAPSRSEAKPSKTSAAEAAPPHRREAPALSKSTDAAHEAPAKKGKAEPPKPKAAASKKKTPAKSVGAPSGGRLEGGAKITSSKYLQFLPGRDKRWGLPQLVNMLERSAKRVAQKYPRSVLRVGDLSREGGGDVLGHRSHESGRDADVAFYVMSREGRPELPPDLVQFDEYGRGPNKLRFDVARNWTLVEHWLGDSQARVTHIFVSAPLRDLLLTHAKQIGVSPSVRHHAALTLMQPKDGMVHDDHFHVRVACPTQQRGTCIEYVLREPTPEPSTQKKTASKPARSRPVLARTRKREGVAGKAAPPLVAAVPAPDDFGEAKADTDEVGELEDEGGEIRVTRLIAASAEGGPKRG